MDTINRKLILQGLVITLIACIADSGNTQLIRHFPQDSTFGKLKTHAFPELQIDGKKMYMGAGGQIRDVNNLLILPAMLNQTGYIRYQIDNMGLVSRIWFLSKEEIQLAKEAAKAHR